MSQLSETHGYTLDFSTVNAKEWVEACIDSINTGREALKRPLFESVIKTTEK
jgi:fido (protein-threonine AMPylation protein)